MEADGALKPSLCPVERLLATTTGENRLLSRLRSALKASASTAGGASISGLNTTSMDASEALQGSLCPAERLETMDQQPDVAPCESLACMRRDRT